MVMAFHPRFCAVRRYARKRLGVSTTADMYCHWGYCSIMHARKAARLLCGVGCKKFYCSLIGQPYVAVSCMILRNVIEFPVVERTLYSDMAIVLHE